jgi:hypothetical protein
MHDVVVMLGQRTGQAGRDVKHSSVMTRRLAEFARKCEDGELRGRKRKREAQKLFLDLLRLM